MTVGDLLERLEALAALGLMLPEAKEAAAHIRALEEENARLRRGPSGCEGANHGFDASGCVFGAMQVSLAKAVEGLEKIARAWSVVATQSEARLMLIDVLGTLASIRQEPKPYDAKEHERFYP